MKRAVRITGSAVNAGFPIQKPAIHMNQTPDCPRCSGQRIAPGRVSAYWPASFVPDETRFFRVGFPFSTTAGALRLTRGFACLDCGLFWTSVSTLDLQMVIEKWGNEELKARLLDGDEAEFRED